jgi:hypothetical protein
MKNSELLATEDQKLRLIERQLRYVLRCLVQKNACPNCGYLLNFFEGAGIEIDDWSDTPDAISCSCAECRRALKYAVPLIPGGGNGGWHWRLVPIDSKN